MLATSSKAGSTARIGPEIRKKMAGVNITPITQAIPKRLFIMLRGTVSRPNRLAMTLLKRPMCSSTNNIQAMARMNPGIITGTTINVVKVLRNGNVVRFSSQANGKAKNVATNSAPKPTIAVFGMTFVIRRELATLAQCFSVNPGSKGRPGTNVMYKTKIRRATTPDKTNQEHPRGKLAIPNPGFATSPTGSNPPSHCRAVHMAHSLFHAK